jgi:urea transport system substrate-binding protein
MTIFLVLLLQFVLLSGGFAVIFWRYGRKLTPLVVTMAAIANRERFVGIPYTEDRGLRGAFARGLLAVRSAVAEADALAAEQKAVQDQQRSFHGAQDWFISQFERSADGLIATVAEAAVALRTTAGSMIVQADETRRRSAATSDMAKAAAGSISTVADAAARLAGMAQHLQAQVGDTAQVSVQAVDMVGQTDEAVRQLSDSAARIAAVVDLITGITHQTKMLALNARIEANRAGEAGQGFAVVSGEIKVLSSKTADATANISSDVHRMDQVVQTAGGALGKIGSAIRSIEGLTANLGTLVVEENQAAAEIGRHAAELTAGVHAMSDHAAAVEGSSSETRVMADHLMEAAKGLAGQSDVLRQTVTGFLGNIRGGSIRIGILHSLSGTMASAEQPLKDLLVMLVDEVNQAGGLLGRPLELVIVNPRSEWSQYGELTRRLLARDKVAALFGCWTSISRKAVLPVVEELGGLLFYPVQYEGEEQSHNIFYTGATPNQQAIPAVDFLMSAAGGGAQRFALVGTDYVYPQVTNQILKGYLRSKRIADAAVRADLMPFSHEDWASIVRQIRQFAKGGRTAVISTINGDSNVHFYRELARQGVRAAELPVMAFSVGENEAAAMPRGLLDGHYVAWNYLMTIETPENRRFRDHWRRYIGKDSAVTDDPMEATWIGFNMWCAAVRQAGSTEPDAVRKALAGRRLRAPSGFEVRMDDANHHQHKPVFIGRIAPSGSIEIASRSDSLVPPSPFSAYLKPA